MIDKESYSELDAWEVVIDWTGDGGDATDSSEAMVSVNTFGAMSYVSALSLGDTLVAKLRGEEMTPE